MTECYELTVLEAAIQEFTQAAEATLDAEGQGNTAILVKYLRHCARTRRGLLEHGHLLPTPFPVEASQ